MLRITPSTRPQRVLEANILPCEIAYTGAVNAEQRFWNPQVESKTPTGNETDATDVASTGEHTVRTAYFRGRKLLGRTAELPTGYRGVIVSSEKKHIAQEAEQESRSDGVSVFSRIARRQFDSADEDEDDQDDGSDGLEVDAEAGEQMVIESMDEIASFQGITVWEHEMLPSAEEPFVRGVEEWLRFAQVVHGSEES